MAASPQALLAPLTESAIFLVLTVAAGGEDAVQELLPELSALRRSVGFRIPEGELSCVTGIGSELWDRLFGEPRPACLHTFRPIAGERHAAVATPGDLLFHIRAHRFDLCFELAQRIVARLDGCSQVVDEVHGFRSFDERDLLGFVDGTENPEDDDAVAAALIGDEDAAFTGGSYVIVQKYLHDMPSWDALSVEAQELAIGREKLSDVELSDERKPSNSHVVLNTIVDDDGEERQIVRRNMPFGHVGSGEAGTYYIAYARDPAVIEEMLRNMFIGKPPGNHDQILDFSTAVTGGLFFVPSSDLLDDPPLPVTPDDGGPGPIESDNTTNADGSLGIGSNREVSP